MSDINTTDCYMLVKLSFGGHTGNDQSKYWLVNSQLTTLIILNSVGCKEDKLKYTEPGYVVNKHEMCKPIHRYMKYRFNYN